MSVGGLGDVGLWGMRVLAFGVLRFRSLGFRGKALEFRSLGSGFGGIMFLCFGAWVVCFCRFVFPAADGFASAVGTDWRMGSHMQV